jgi:hypothetical protein
VSTTTRPAGEHRPGEQDLDPGDLRRPAARARLDVRGGGGVDDVAAHLVQRDRVAAGRLGVEHELGRGLLAVADVGRQRGRDVVVHRAGRRADERVDERALALLELADDHDVDARGVQPALHVRQPPGEVGPVVGGAGAEAELDHLERRRDLAVARRDDGPRGGHGGCPSLGEWRGWSGVPESRTCPRRVLRTIRSLEPAAGVGGTGRAYRGVNRSPWLGRPPPPGSGRAAVDRPWVPGRRTAPAVR